MAATFQTAPNKRKLIDRRAVMVRLEKLLAKKSPEKFRQILLDELKKSLNKGRDFVQTSLEASDINGPEAAASLSYLADQTVRIIFDFGQQYVFKNPFPTDAERVSIVAVGGYGRGELAPQSDIDLMFLMPYKDTPWAENTIEFMLYLLWDLGFHVGHSVRTVSDCIRQSKQDLSIKTSLLEARYIWGDQELFKQLKKRYKSDIKKASGAGVRFVEDKLLERDNRHERMGDTRYVVEPNIKDGKGGMRDLHALYWIARFLYDIKTIDELVPKGLLKESELATFVKAENFFWAVRFHLHYIAKRADERLTFDKQNELGKRLRYRDARGLTGMERFMKHYFLMAKDVGDLTRVFCAVLEARHQKTGLMGLGKLTRWKKVEGFPLDGNRLTISRSQNLTKEPILMMRLFHVADKHGLAIHPDALLAISNNLRLVNSHFQRDPEANDLFMNLLTSTNHPENNLRRMNEAGLLGKFIPDFGRVVAQLQHDMYHHYTVDEHTIQAIGLLAQSEKNQASKEHPLAAEILGKVTSRRVLYVAVFLHDIAKGRGGDHSVLGAEVAQNLCPRLGLSPSETEMVAWLVKNHLMMSHMAFKRDISDPALIEEFINLIKSPERLRLLCVLTIVDIRAVGPNVWNTWKRQLLSDLYYAAEEVMVAGSMAKGRESRIEQKKKELRLRLKDWDDEKFSEYESRFVEAYWIAEHPDYLEENARLIEATTLAGQDLGVSLRVSEDKKHTIVSLYVKDELGLFARTAGAMLVGGASIVNATVFTTKDGMVLNNYAVQDFRGSVIDRESRLSKLKVLVTEAISGKLDLDATIDPKVTGLPLRDVYLEVEPVVLIDNKASSRFTIIEINGKNRPGLLYDISSVLYRRKISIAGAYIATYGERAVDVFYVQETNGKKITHKGRLKALKENLKSAILNEYKK
jgi:[protein-PII] uridylyltransferase